MGGSGAVAMSPSRSQLKAISLVTLTLQNSLLTVLREWLVWFLILAVALALTTWFALSAVHYVCRLSVSLALPLTVCPPPVAQSAARPALLGACGGAPERTAERLNLPGGGRLQFFSRSFGCPSQTWRHVCVPAHPFGSRFGSQS